MKKVKGEEQTVNSGRSSGKHEDVETRRVKG
jgi:hypothetical protein